MGEKIGFGNTNVILTNPPFGKKIVVKGAPILSQYDLGYKWAQNKETKQLEKTGTLHEDQPPQILFLERCIQLLKPGGRMGIVLPEAVFGMPTYEYVVAYLRQRVKIRGVISMPEAFQNERERRHACKDLRSFPRKHATKEKRGLAHFHGRCQMVRPRFPRQSDN